MAGLILMVGGEVGNRILDILISGNENIVRVFIHQPENALGQYAVAAASARAIPWDNSEATRGEVPNDLLRLGQQDTLISVYWPYLLSPAWIGLARETVNFHPAMLPMNRGWYPHVHNLLDGSPAGVTLHRIDNGADTGPIWAQQRVPVLPTDTSATLYRRLQEAIVSLFVETWPKIRSGMIVPIPQGVENACYHKKKEVDALDFIDPEALYTGRQLIDRLRARSFGQRGFACTEIDGTRVYLNLRLSHDNDFSRDA